MIISRTPFRISFIGGGTDFPDWYNYNGGKVISTTINKYCYVNIRKLPPFFKFKYRLRYFKTEEKNHISQIDHPSIKETLKYKKYYDRFELVHTADLPAQSGLGASSSFTVGLLNCLYTLQEKLATKRKLALDALEIEQNLIKEAVGSQDQFAAAFGGFNVINFQKNNIEVKQIPINSKNIQELEKSVYLIFTGFQRRAAEQEKKKMKNIKKMHNFYKLISELTIEGEKLIYSSTNIVKDFSYLINEYWKIKKSLSNSVSNNKIDSLINHCRKSGAESVKLLGAGNGGFLLCLVKNKKKFVSNLKKKMYVPIKFEGIGSQIIYLSNI